MKNFNLCGSQKVKVLDSLMQNHFFQPAPNTEQQQTQWSILLIDISKTVEQRMIILKTTKAKQKTFHICFSNNDEQTSAN